MAFPQGAAPPQPRRADASPTPGARKSWEARAGAKCPEGAEQVLGAGHRDSSSLPCRWLSPACWGFGLGQCWGQTLPVGTFTSPGDSHHGSRTQTCRWLQLLQDGGDGQLLLLRGGAQVLVVQQLEQDAELWQELVQHCGEQEKAHQPGWCQRAGPETRQKGLESVEDPRMGIFPSQPGTAPAVFAKCTRAPSMHKLFHLHADTRMQPAEPMNGNTSSAGYWTAIKGFSTQIFPRS